MVLKTLSYMYTVYSHRILRTDSQFSIQTSAHTHTHPSGGPSSVCANKLPFSSPPASLSLLQSPSVSSDRRSRTPPQWTALRERERGSEKGWEREREMEMEKAWTLHSSLFSQAQENEFLTRYKRAFLSTPSPLSFSCLPFAALFSPFSPSPTFSSSSPYNVPSFFAFLSSKEILFC